MEQWYGEMVAGMQQAHLPQLLLVHLHLWGSETDVNNLDNLWGTMVTLRHETHLEISLRNLWFSLLLKVHLGEWKEW